MTSRQIGDEVNVPFRTILRYLKSAGVKMRPKGYLPIEALSHKEWLYGEYFLKRKSSTQIAAEIGCSNHSVTLWLRRHGLQARSSGSEAGHTRNSSDACRKALSKKRRGKYLGENNPNWKGGIQLRDPDRGRYPYKVWTKAVKDRDGWKCTKCGSTDRLHSHHIKAWRYYPDLRYDVSNGITLCHECHEKEHGRGWKFRWPQHAKIPKSASA